MEEYFLIEDTSLMCDKGNTISKLKVTSQNFATYNDKLKATEKDNIANENIFSFGICSITQKSCIPNPTDWIDKKEKDTINSFATITDKSKLPCAFGGMIDVKEVGQNSYGIGKAKENNNNKNNNNPSRSLSEITEVQFLDENNTILIQENLINFGNIKATNILYGRKIKIRIKTKSVNNDTAISFAFKVHHKRPSLKYSEIEKLNWNLTIINNKCETSLFILNPLWYNESNENYNVTTHKTEINEKELNTFYIEGNLNSKNFVLPKEEEQLKPVSYLRNYEELIGLLNTDDSGEKEDLNNYENYFIAKNSTIFELVESFSKFINTTNNLNVTEIKGRIEKDALKLWEEAVLHVQNGNLDDRPLYWARNKMQVCLKRHPIFEKDIDFEKSVVKKGTELDKIIQLFEEKSRNYTGVDFVRTASRGKKKLLISGFDPFILNPAKRGNILQSNPSGVNALSLHNKIIGDYYIQTFIFPVRYSDFDKGIIEKYFTPHLYNVDMIITISQGSIFRFELDRFPCKNRGGFMDNMYWGNSAQGYNQENFKQLAEGKEFYETTLPYNKIVPNKNNPNDTFWVYFNQTFRTTEKENKKSDIEGIELIENKSIPIINNLSELQNLKSVEGSGGDYLSNEIFYRVSKIRVENRPTLQTGHLHIPLIQYKGNILNPRNSSITVDINPKIKELIETIKNLIHNNI